MLNNYGTLSALGKEAKLAKQRRKQQEREEEDRRIMEEIDNVDIRQELALTGVSLVGLIVLVAVLVKVMQFFY